MSSRSLPVWICLGSNLGNRVDNLSEARREMAAAGLEEEKISSLYETTPVGPVEQGDFLNQVVRSRWKGSHGDLLAALKTIERRMGRTEGARWGPRIIDLDILMIGAEGRGAVCEPHLTIPHREMLARMFVLAPLAEIEPDLVLPGEERTAPELLPPPGALRKLVRPFGAAPAEAESAHE